MGGGPMLGLGQQVQRTQQQNASRYLNTQSTESLQQLHGKHGNTMIGELRLSTIKPIIKNILNKRARESERQRQLQQQQTTYVRPGVVMFPMGF